MIERQRLGARRGGPAFCLCCWLMACGSNVEHENGGRGSAIAGSAMVGASGDAPGQSAEGMGEAAGGATTGNAPAGSTPAGTGGGSGGGGGGMGGSGGHAGAPLPTGWPLIEGDPGCPALAPNVLTCGDDELTCVYPGLDRAVYSPLGEVRCACLEKQWWCMPIEPGVPTHCPLGPSNEAPCPSGADPSVSCNYHPPGQAWAAQCWCKLPFPDDQGIGGAAPVWMCGL
jgi:hypothetical protein